MAKIPNPRNIQLKEPRPLTEEEQARLENLRREKSRQLNERARQQWEANQRARQERMEAEAAQVAQQLAVLEAKFAKPKRHNNNDVRQPSSNGFHTSFSGGSVDWSKQDKIGVNSGSNRLSAKAARQKSKKH